MCAQKVNIEEQCAEHFLLQNDRSADRVNRGDQFWLKNRTLETENICHNFLTWVKKNRTFEKIQNIFGLRVNLLQNKFKISVMGDIAETLSE